MYVFICRPRSFSLELVSEPSVIEELVGAQATSHKLRRLQLALEGVRGGTLSLTVVFAATVLLACPTLQSIT